MLARMVDAGVVEQRFGSRLVREHAGTHLLSSESLNRQCVSCLFEGKLSMEAGQLQCVQKVISDFAAVSRDVAAKPVPLAVLCAI